MLESNAFYISNGLTNIMKMLYDLFPLLLFFAAFKFFGIYTATAIAIAASILQLGFTWLKTKKFDVMQVITCIMIVVFGSLTLFLHNDMFIKWKPSVINWLFAFIFLATQLFGKKSLIESLLADKVTMPKQVWKNLNYMWIAFFSFVGFANIYVVYHFNTDQWVNFKVFGVLGLTVVFGIFQATYIAKHIKTTAQNKSHRRKYD